MKLNDVLERLITIARASNGGVRGGTVLACDMLHQDALYTLQEQLASLLADVANACGPDEARRLERQFPFTFSHS